MWKAYRGQKTSVSRAYFCFTCKTYVAIRYVTNLIDTYCFVAPVDLAIGEVTSIRARSHCKYW